MGHVGVPEAGASGTPVPDKGARDTGPSRPTPAGSLPAAATGTRAAHTWVALAVGFVLLVVVLVFILQNLDSVRVHFFWLNWSIPLGVDLLLATVIGGLIMFAAGSLRMAELRRAARRKPGR